MIIQIWLGVLLFLSALVPIAMFMTAVTDNPDWYEGFGGLLMIYVGASGTGWLLYSSMKLLLNL